MAAVLKSRLDPEESGVWNAGLIRLLLPLPRRHRFVLEEVQHLAGALIFPSILFPLRLQISPLYHHRIFPLHHKTFLGWQISQDQIDGKAMRLGVVGEQNHGVRVPAINPAATQPVNRLLLRLLAFRKMMGIQHHGPRPFRQTL